MFTLRFTLGAVRSVDFVRCMVRCSPHRIIQGSLTTFTIGCALGMHPLPSSLPLCLEATDLFIVFPFLPFLG